MSPFKKIKTIWKCRKEILLDYKIRVDFIAFQREWRIRNPHNSTVAGCKFDINKVDVGDATYGTLNIHCWDSPEEHIKIGNYCSIAEDVNFILGGVHPIHKITTFPYKSHVLGMNNVGNTGTNGEIVIEDDVWICYGATILSGVRIGKGSIIAAKSTVSKDVPPYSIIIDGKVKKYRFPEKVIKELKVLDLGLIRILDDPSVAERILDEDVTEDNIKLILTNLNKR